MANKKQPGRPQAPLLGPAFKVCRCGARIERNNMNNMQWLRKTFCGRACHYASVTGASWKRRRFIT